jgi:SHS2 domain-containing protein
MPFEYVEDSVTSDVTFHAWSETLDELFAAAVDATTNGMVADLDAIRPNERREVEVDATEIDLLLLRLLDEIVFLKDAEGLLVRAEAVHVDAEATPLRSRAILVGERIDRTRHELAADVKGVTLYGLRVEHVDPFWHARVTLDV